MYVRNKNLLKIVGVGIIGLILGTGSPVEAQQATLVNTINTTTFGSSDPAGLGFFPANASIWLADSEVEETPFFTGFNLFELTGSGAVLRPYSTLGFSNEPTGVTFNTVTGTFFISDDVKRMVFEVNPVNPETALSSFSTLAFGSTDPSDITFDPTTGNLFISDGFDKTVFEVTPSGTLLRSFLLPGVIRDAEGIVFDRCSGNLFIVSGPDKNKIFELTTSGVMVNPIDITPIGVTRPKGITFAPSSNPGDDPNIFHVYIADYGADEVNDGRLFEIFLAGNSGCTGTPPQVTSGPTTTPNVIFADQTAQLSVTASDADGDPLTYTWTVMPGGGTITGTGDTVTYTPPAAITGQQTFTITVKVRDGNGGSDTGTVGVTVLPLGGGVTFTPEADTFVNSNSPNTNYGAAPTLQVDGSPTQITYLRFNVTGLSGVVQSARLRLEVVNASVFGGRIYSISDNSWGERTVTFNTRPVIDAQSPLGSLGAVAVGNIVELDVTAAISGNGTYNFAMDSNNSDGAYYRSREAVINPPALVITTGGGPANTPPTASNVAITGTAVVGQVLTGNYTYADADGDLEGTSTYRWLRNGASISGATAKTYTLVAADQGALIVFEVTPVAATGASPGVPVQSPAVGPVAPANTPPQITSGPTATPNPVAENQTAQLSVTASDADGDPLTYTWTAPPGGGTISGTGATVTYTPPDVSVQQTFTITVTVSDGRGGTATGSVGVTVQPVGGGGGTQATFTPVADTYVNSSSPNTNYGSRTTLQVDGSPTQITYLRFNVTGLSGVVQSARLRLEVVNPSSFGGTIYSMSNNTWGETTVTFNTRPAIDGPARDVLGAVALGAIVELDVTAAIPGNGTYSFAMDSNNSNGAGYRSREAVTNPPLLIITTN
ncbi:MAG: DUF7594 domain-containing protein [Nitrososphaera sp.]